MSVSILCNTYHAINDLNLKELVKERCRTGAKFLKQESSTTLKSENLGRLSTFGLGLLSYQRLFPNDQETLDIIHNIKAAILNNYDKQSNRFYTHGNKRIDREAEYLSPGEALLFLANYYSLVNGQSKYDIFSSARKLTAPTVAHHFPDLIQRFPLRWNSVEKIKVSGVNS